MNPDLYRQAENLFFAALDIPPGGRDAFLTERCGTDPELRREVESLLAAHGEPGGFLETPPIGAAYDMLVKLDSRFTIGSEVGPYKILGLLGRGGMGEVYLAEDRRLDRRVALKILPLHYTGDSDRLRRFIKEAKAASSLNHPNIITIHEIGQEAGAHFIAAEYVEGQTLRQQLPLLTPADTLEIAIQIASALAAAQNSGIVHRDIKPENIMVRPDGLVKILDFGIAKLTMRGSKALHTLVSMEDRAMTAAGLVIGTLQYMSPEQARGVEVDARTDIFSLGVVIYEMLTGKAPFDGETQNDIIAAVLTAEPEPITRLNPSVSPELQRIVFKALQKKAADRYQTAKELLIDLKNHRQELEITTRAKRTTSEMRIGWTTGEIQSGELLLPAVKLRVGRKVLPALAAGVLIIGGFSWWLIQRMTNDDGDFTASLRAVQIINQKSEPDAAPFDMTISPDGRMIAFSQQKGTERNLWLKLIAEGEPVPITRGEARNFNPIWSPDGLQIAFVAEQGTEIVVYRMPAIGGAAKQVVVFPAGARPVLKRWSKKASALFYELQANLYRLDLSTGRSEKLTNFDAVPGSPQDFAVSADEDQLAFIESRDRQVDLWVMRMNGSARRRITNDEAREQRPVWHPDGERILYGSDRNGPSQVYVSDLEAVRTLQITFGEMTVIPSDISADGRLLAYGGSREEADVWSRDLETGEEHELTSTPGVETAGVPAPTGERLLYQSFVGSLPGSKVLLMSKSLDADARPVELVAGALDAQWSPNGAQIAFIRKAGDLNFLYTIKAAGGDERKLSGRDVNLQDSLGAANGFYAWSPDATRIVYTSHEPGKVGVWTATADGASEQNLVTSENGNFFYQSPRWSPQGDRIAFVSNRRVGVSWQWSLWLAHPVTGEIRMLAEAPRPGRLLGWSVDGKELLYAVPQQDSRPGTDSVEAVFLRISIEGNAPKEWLRFPVALQKCRLSPDATSLVCASRQNGKENLWSLAPNGNKKLTMNNDPRMNFSLPSFAANGKTIYFSRHVHWKLATILGKDQ